MIIILNKNGIQLVMFNDCFEVYIQRSQDQGYGLDSSYSKTDSGLTLALDRFNTLLDNTI